VTDNELMALLISIVAEGLTAQSLSVPVLQEYQPTLQGTPSTDAVFIFKLNENRFGFAGKHDVYDSGTSKMNHTESELIERMYQVGALAIQNPANTTQTTAADYVRAVGRILQSDVAIVNLNAHGVGIQRIRTMRQPYFKDDAENFEASPSFDFTVVNYDTFVQVAPSTADISGTETGFH